MSCRNGSPSRIKVSGNVEESMCHAISKAVIAVLALKHEEPKRTKLLNCAGFKESNISNQNSFVEWCLLDILKYVDKAI